MTTDPSDRETAASDAETDTLEDSQPPESVFERKGTDISNIGTAKPNSALRGRKRSPIVDATITDAEASKSTKSDIDTEYQARSGDDELSAETHADSSDLDRVNTPATIDSGTADGEREDRLAAYEDIETGSGPGKKLGDPIEARPYIHISPAREQVTPGNIIAGLFGLYRAGVTER